MKELFNSLRPGVRAFIVVVLMVTIISSLFALASYSPFLFIVLLATATASAIFTILKYDFEQDDKRKAGRPYRD